MKRKLALLCSVLIFLSGIGLLSYPLVSSLINTCVSRSQVKEYTELVAVLPNEAYKTQIEEAERYNETLFQNMKTASTQEQKAFAKVLAEYDSILNFGDTGLIGYVEIPKIDVFLPIYHGTDPHVLSRGAGHLQYSSFPVGGESTHGVISAHTAYPGRVFFDSLTEMEIGDAFYIHILDRTLKYEVDSIQAIRPEEVNSLGIVEGEDLVTLFTCTPYSINTHRLLVRGHRTAYDDTEYVETGVTLAAFDGGHIFWLGIKLSYRAAGLLMLGYLALAAAAVALAMKYLPARRIKPGKTGAEWQEERHRPDDQP